MMPSEEEINRAPIKGNVYFCVTHGAPYGFREDQYHGSGTLGAWQAQNMIYHQISQLPVYHSYRAAWWQSHESKGAAKVECIGEFLTMMQVRMGLCACCLCGDAFMVSLETQLQKSLGKRFYSSGMGPRASRS